jgi:hypothetical protein
LFQELVDLATLRGSRPLAECVEVERDWPGPRLSGSEGAAKPRFECLDGGRLGGTAGEDGRKLALNEAPLDTVVTTALAAVNDVKYGADVRRGAVSKAQPHCVGCGARLDQVSLDAVRVVDDRVDEQIARGKPRDPGSVRPNERLPRLGESEERAFLLR